MVHSKFSMVFSTKKKRYRLILMKNYSLPGCLMGVTEVDGIHSDGCKI